MPSRRISESKKAVLYNKTEEGGRHFASVSIENFRCFKMFSMDSFGRINLIGGKNNSGKTSLLEALFLLVGGSNIGLILNINRFRGIETYAGDSTLIPETLWKPLFFRFNDQAKITIIGNLGIGGQISLTLSQIAGVSTTLPVSKPPQGKSSADSSELAAQALRVIYKDITGKTHSNELRVDVGGIKIPSPVVNPIFQGIIHPARRRPPQDEIAQRYGQLELNWDDSQLDLLEPMRIIEPRLKNLKTIASASGPVLYGDIGLGRMLPLPMMGDGLVNFIAFITSISSAKGGVVLIDEIENGLHYSTYMKVWQAIAEAARKLDTQIFATTHSWDCIKAAHEAFSKSPPYDFRYHRLEQVGESIEAVTFDQDTLQTMIESDWEVR